MSPAGLPAIISQIATHCLNGSPLVYSCVFHRLWAVTFRNECTLKVGLSLCLYLYNRGIEVMKQKLLSLFIERLSYKSGSTGGTATVVSCIGKLPLLCAKNDASLYASYQSRNASSFWKLYGKWQKVRLFACARF